MSSATADRFEAPVDSRAERLRKALIGTAPIFLVLLVLLVLIIIENPNFVEPPVFLAFLKRAAPLVILAAGQYFVIVSGEFDLSVGSLVTVVVVVAARLSDGDPANTWPVIALLLAMGAAVGLANGLITTRLHVPSFITTLGMLLILAGAVFLWTGGAPRGALADNFREIGRLVRRGGGDPARRVRRSVGAGRAGDGVRGDHRGRPRRGRPWWRPWHGARRDGGCSYPGSALHVAQSPGRLRRPRGHRAGHHHHRRRRVRLVPPEGRAMNGRPQVKNPEEG
jgi:hypothetical protein